MPRPDPETASPSSHVGVRALLDEFTLGDPGEVLRLGELLSRFGQSAFGLLLFIAVLPAFIPIPGVGGAIGGPLVILIGVQLLVGLSRLWLPGFIAERGPHRSAMIRFRTRLDPWLQRLERLVRPRMDGVLDHKIALSFTGLLLMLLGFLLALPIPLTNYLFGVLLLLFALALLERDGALMLVAWIAGSIAVLATTLLSSELVAMTTAMFHRWLG